MKTVNLQTMSLQELQERMKIFALRGSQMCGRTMDGQPLGPQVKKFFDDLLVSTNDPEKIRQRNEFFERAETDPVTRQQLCALRIETFNNYVLATVNIMAMFFEIVNLANDERPVVQNTTNQEIGVNYIAQDGGVKTVKVVKDDNETLIPLRMLTTDKVRYKRTDIYHGTIVDAALATLRMAYDMKNQMDGLCYTLLQTGLGTFRYYKDGEAPAIAKKSLNTYLPNSRINVANLPTTNDIVLPDNSGTTSFRYRVFRAAKKYVGQWAGCFAEGDLSLTGRVLVPGADAADIGDEIVPSGSTRNKVADELMEQGWARVTYLGTDFVMQTDNTLPPNYCFFELNRKPGRVYLKPGLDRDHVWGENDYHLSQANEEERWSQKVFGSYMPTTTRMNFLRVRYRT